MKERRGRLAGIFVTAGLLVALVNPAHAGAATAPATDGGVGEGGTALGFEVTLDDRIEPPDGAALGKTAVAGLPGEATGSGLATAPTLAQIGDRSWYLGVRGGAYFDVDDPFVGVEALLPLTEDLWFNPNFEWVFVSRGDLYTINLDVHYDLSSSGPYTFWVGGGLALVRFDPPGPLGADTDAGLNLLGGVGFSRSGWIPYVQAKFLIDDDTEFVLAGGIRF